MDAFIPQTLLAQESVFDEDQQCWVWRYQDDSGKYYDLPYESQKPIQFKVSLFLLIKVVYDRYSQQTFLNTKHLQKKQ